MRKMWRVILSIVLILILIGIIAVTGADSARIYQTAENNNLINLIVRYYDWVVQVVRTYWTAVFGA